MAFRFRLAKVLRYRQRVVDQRSRELAAAGRALQNAQNHLDELTAAIACERSEAAATPGSSLDMNEVVVRQRWLRHLEARQAAAREIREGCAVELERRRDILTAAWRDLEVLVKLRERQRLVWQQEDRRREGRLMDEIGGQRSERARRSKLSG